jgi:hypothetical protein
MQIEKYQTQIEQMEMVNTTARQPIEQNEKEDRIHPANK